MLESGVGARVRVKVRARVRDSWGTKPLGTKGLGYEMSVSHDQMFSILNSTVTNDRDIVIH